MKQILVCNNCDTLLSKPVEIFDNYIEKPRAKKKYFFQKKQSLPNLSEGQIFANVNDILSPICDSGNVVLSHVDFIKAIKLGCHADFIAPTPQYWMNVDDLLEEFELDDDNVEDQFCCGPSGLYGLNTLCTCGQHIGTQCLECCSPEAFIPDNEKTRWQNVK